MTKNINSSLKVQSNFFITMKSVPKFWYRYKEKRTKQNTWESMGKKDLQLKLKNFKVVSNFIIRKTIEKNRKINYK